MKKGLYLCLLFTCFILITVSSVYAQTNTTQEQQNINDAYECLETEVENNCASLSTEEKIFSLLAINECRTELNDASSNEGECWTSGGVSECSVKTTSQAILALDNANANTDKSRDWLLTQTRSPPELTWYLEIESPEATTCTIGYGGSSYNVNIGEDKRISSNAGSCLTLDQDNYWLRVSPTCFNQEFSISCNQDFLTTLLFRKTTSSTIHVSGESSSAAPQGTTTERVNSFCFSQNNVCNYEGTLWAALVLNSLGEDVSPYMPYLITLAEDNPRFLPEAFLYFINGDSSDRISLLSKQKSNKWWEESGDRYYDTALALYPFQGETIIEKTNSQNWLFDVQDANGCWDSSNVRNTAFILSSVWPRNFPGSGGSGGGGTTSPDCVDAGNYCVPTGTCEGVVLPEYSCSALFRCCSVPTSQETCLDLGGEVCSSNEFCSGGTDASTPGLATGQSCCVGGTCEVAQQPTASECELAGGVCRGFSCDNNEEKVAQSCDLGGEVCCIAPTSTSGGGSLLWLWILIVLVILVVIGIIFRDRLRVSWHKFKSRFGKSRPGSSGGPPHRPGFGPVHHRPPPPRPSAERRVLVPHPRSAPPHAKPGPKPKSTAEKELDDVLKKLKDLSK